jgi:hypothetical protein
MFGLREFPSSCSASVKSHMRHFRRLLAIPRTSSVRPYFKQQRPPNVFTQCRHFAQEIRPAKEMPEIVTSPRVWWKESTVYQVRLIKPTSCVSEAHELSDLPGVFSRHKWRRSWRCSRHHAILGLLEDTWRQVLRSVTTEPTDIKSI